MKAKNMAYALIDELVKVLPNGSVAYITNRERHEYVTSNGKNSLSWLNQANQDISVNPTAVAAIKQGKSIREKIVDQGAKYESIAVPMVDEDGIEGVIGFVVPKIHPTEASFNELADIIISLQREDSAVSILGMDAIKYHKQSAGFDIPEIRLGAPTKDLAIFKQAMDSKQIVRISTDNYMNKYGPHRISMVPLFDEDGPFGALGTIRRNSIPYELDNMAKSMLKSSQEMAAVTEEVAASATEVNGNEIKISNLMEELQRTADKLNDIANFVNESASETKLLGLNAAIEAARVGEAGRGFGVVAEEIRKFSEYTDNMSKQIFELIKEIHAMINIVTDTTKKNNETTQEVAAAMQEVSASIADLSNIADNINKVAAKLL